MPLDWTNYANFSESELACQGTGTVMVSERFMEELQALRTEFGQGMTINSGCRSAEHNRNVGGHPRSLHICDEPAHPGQDGCLAVDIRTSSGVYRGQLFQIAWQRGWSIGWNAKKNFLHLDRRDFVGLPQNSFDYG